MLCAVGLQVLFVIYIYQFVLDKSCCFRFEMVVNIKGKRVVCPVPEDVPVVNIVHDEVFLVAPDR